MLDIDVTCAGAEWVTWAYWSSAILRHTTLSIIVTIFWVHSVWEILENAWIWNKKLQGHWKCLKTDKVLESTWKVLGFKSCEFWNFAFIITVLVSTVQYTSVSHCSLNFECPRLGYGFLSIILVLEKCNLGPWEVLEFCTFSLLRTLNFV